MSTEVLNLVEASRALPNPVGDRVPVEVRGTRYGEPMFQPLTGKTIPYADEGSYNVLTSPTPGTGIATIAVLTTLVDTSPFFLVQNTWGADDTAAKRLYPDYLKLICTAPGTAGASLRYAVKIDQARADRYTSGSGLGTVPLLAQNPNMGAGAASKANFYAGALVAATAPQSRLLSNGFIRSVIPVIGDTYLFDFGATNMNLSGGIVGGTAIYNGVFPVAPTVIGPQQWMAFHIWLPSQSAASSYEIEFGYWER